MIGLEGIYFMMPTPFDDKYRVEYDSIPTLVELAVKAGCQGIVCLGVMGEASRLSDSERKLMLESVIKEVKGRLIVVTGANSAGTDITIQRCIEAAELGATALMLTPVPIPKQNLSAIFNFYKAVTSAIKLPIVVQDYPKESNVFMPSDFISLLHHELEMAQYLKLEDPPTPPKVTAIKNLTEGKMGIFGGLGGVFLLEELKRGACGTMTGFAYPEILVSVHKHMSAGEEEQAAEVFFRYLPLIRYEAQEGIGLSLRKEVLKRRGMLRHANVRHPGIEIDEVTRQELFRLLHTMKLA